MTLRKSPVSRTVGAAAVVSLSIGGLVGCAGAGDPIVRAPSRTALPSPRVSAGQLDPNLLLGQVPARASRLGAGAPALVASGLVADNGWIGGFVEVPAADCMLGYARGSASIADVDVAIYSEEGTSLAVDEGPDVHPTVMVCAPHPRRMYLAAHVVDGEGLVAAGAQLVPRERALVVARALGARGSAGPGPWAAEAWPGLDDAVRSHRIELGGSWQEFRRVAIGVDARMPTYAAFPLDADGCVDAVVVPDDDVALLDVEAVDDHGRIIGRAKEGAGTRTLTVCSPMQVTGALAVRPHLGRGLAAVVLARTVGDASRDLAVLPDIVWAAPVETIDKAKSVREALLAKSGYERPSSSVSGTLTLGHRVSLPLDLRSLGVACGRVDVVSGAPLAFVDARISSDSGSLLASAEASSSVAMFVCARSPAHLELETRGRPGPFVVTVRPEPWNDAAFEMHPLAASRMFARAATGPAMLLEGKGTATRELVLDGERSASWTETIPPGRCLRLVVGGQGEGAGIELRLFDGADEIDRSEAAHAASVHACAPAASQRIVRFEVRASAGRVDAVAGERSSAVP